MRIKPKCWTPDDDDRLIELITIHGLTHAQAAKKLGRSRNAVDSRVDVIQHTILARSQRAEDARTNESYYGRPADMWTAAMGRI